MSVRILPDFLINQIAAGEVVERPASVIKELAENALDAGADQIILDVVDGGRTSITVTDNGRGMSYDDLGRSITRHATSKLPDDDLLNINFMGFRGEALPSIASVSDMVIDTCNRRELNGWSLDCTSGEIKPSSWESGTRVRVQNLFAKTPARLKFLRSDRAEMMSVVEVVKRLAMARPDIGFTLNNKWRFPKKQSQMERIVAVMGAEVQGRMLEIDNQSEGQGVLHLHGFISEPTLRRASSIDQYLFVNGRPVKDKVLIGALRASYMDVMHAREFPLCALYLEMDAHSVDVNVSPAKTDVHFLEPARVRGFIIKTLRAALAQTMARSEHFQPASITELHLAHMIPSQSSFAMDFETGILKVCQPASSDVYGANPGVAPKQNVQDDVWHVGPLGRVIGQLGNKYILAQSEQSLVIIDQHAAHERIVYERLRTHNIKVQPLLAPIVINLKVEQVSAIMEVRDDIKTCGLTLDQFGEDAIAIFEKPADWDLDWPALLCDIAAEVMVHGHSAKLHEKLHLKLANYACHHSVRAGQKLDYAQMDALLREIENTERAGQCNHGRPVYKIIKMSELDGMFERA